MTKLLLTTTLAAILCAAPYAASHAAPSPAAIATWTQCSKTYAASRREAKAAGESRAPRNTKRDFMIACLGLGGN